MRGFVKEAGGFDFVLRNEGSKGGGPIDVGF